LFVDRNRSRPQTEQRPTINELAYCKILVYFQSITPYEILKIFSLIVLALVIVYLLGPKPSKPAFLSANHANDLLAIKANSIELEKEIAQAESKHNLKADNEARILWFNDSLKNETEYSIVYLHGFSASQEEGDPVHRHIAREFGCNLYLSRLAEHGIDTSESLINFTVDKYWESAKDALRIGERLGKKVILMATSTALPWPCNWRPLILVVFMHSYLCHPILPYSIRTHGCSIIPGDCKLQGWLLDQNILMQRTCDPSTGNTGIIIIDWKPLCN
jgi:hypothetical protein